MQHIEPPCCGVGIDASLTASVGVEVIKPDGQACAIRIPRIMPDLKIADRAVGVE
jgi:hypothetical protein